MSEFAPGFATRHVAVADALQRAFAPSGFEEAPVTPAPPRRSKTGPKHFEPANPSHDPTEGWDPFDVDAMAAPETHEFVDPIATAHAAGFAAGRAAALAELSATQDHEKALVEALSAAFAQGSHFNRDKVALRLRQTVLHLVSKLVGEIGVSGELLGARVTAAVDLLADSSESSILRLNPADVALVEGHVPSTVFPIGDAAVARGSFVVESASTVVEDGPEIWLEQLALAIDQVPLPKSC